MKDWKKKGITIALMVVAVWVATAVDKAFNVTDSIGNQVGKLI